MLNAPSGISLLSMIFIVFTAPTSEWQRPRQAACACCDCDPYTLDYGFSACRGWAPLQVASRP
eukprot:scaffold769_cov72-Phaeocystis_antarctica.AAC.3